MTLWDLLKVSELVSFVNGEPSLQEPLRAHESKALQSITFLLLFTEDPAY